HRHRRPPLHLLRHRREARPARRPGTAPPQAGAVRGPDPLRQGHRAAEPPAQRLRPEPGLVRDRGPGLRTAGLDAAARPHRPGPPLGAETPPPARLRPRRPAGPRRPPPAATPRRALALGPGHYRRSHPPAGPPGRLTSQNHRSNQEREHQGPWNPAHPARQPGNQARHDLKINPSRTPQSTTPRSRKIEVKPRRRADHLSAIQGQRCTLRIFATAARNSAFDLRVPAGPRVLRCVIQREYRLVITHLSATGRESLGRSGGLTSLDLTLLGW